MMGGDGGGDDDGDGDGDGDGECDGDGDTRFGNNICRLHLICIL